MAGSRWYKPGIACASTWAGPAQLLVSDAELEKRREALLQAGGYAYPPSQTPWQEIQRRLVGQLDGGGILEGASNFNASPSRKDCRGIIINSAAQPTGLHRGFRYMLKTSSARKLTRRVTDSALHCGYASANGYES